MTVEEIIKEIDRYYVEGRVEELEAYLVDCLKQGREAGDDRVVAFVLNELIGFLRDMNHYEDALRYGEEALQTLEELGQKDSIAYATTLINQATCLRAAGRLTESLERFQEVVPIYERHLKPDDFLIASYSNNLSLLYQEMGDYDNACLCLEHALSIALKYPDKSYEAASSYANLGISKIRSEKVEEGIACLQEAIKRFDEVGEHGYHYSAALSGMGEAMYCLGRYAESMSYYERAAVIIKTVYGDTDAYQTMLENGKAVADACIEDIVKREWAFFDKVQNEGGRADCQDDWETFSIMRRSQYMAWNGELLGSYLEDLKVYEEAGENPISYKYGYMMESTSPEQFAEIREKLPEVEPERLALINQIVAIQVEWLEAFAAKYPKVAGRGRAIHTSEDSAWNTSAETYLRGELLTYSDRTLKLYGAYIVSISKEGGNLNATIMENTVHLYGYASLDDAEADY